ncbi:hypothetical protein ACE6H2_010370 [Prunus campanulata]
MQTLNKRLEEVITCINTRASSLAKLLVTMATQPPPPPMPTDKGRDGDHPRTKASPAPPQAPPRRHP